MLHFFVYLRHLTASALLVELAVALELREEGSQGVPDQLARESGEDLPPASGG